MFIPQRSSLRSISRNALLMMAAFSFLMASVPMPAWAQTPAKPGAEHPAKPETPPPASVTVNPELKRPVATIETGKGTIKIELYPEEAPVTVKNFLDLIGKGFYDGLTFHRVEPEFVIQGGDPNGNGSGGPGYTIPDENNKKMKHGRGAVAMAKTAAPNSAGSQFYIVIKKSQPFLDGKYTVFGQVIAGQDVAEQIAVGDKMLKVTAQTPPPSATASAAPVSKESRAAEPTMMIRPMIPIFSESKPLKKTAVKVKVTVEADGKSQVLLKESTGLKEMDNALLDALKQWRWNPAIKEGKPVKSDQTFRYDLFDGSAQL